ncbi:hypothetical protein EDC01DRAFT_622085 [Geopyxis carbonaria]|nr:hypothetical protein EDC01DRAFT_622085 [Geopyxis carbonaria]
MGYRVNLHINDPSDDGVPGEHAKVHFTRKWRRWHRAIIIFVSSAMGAFYGAIHATKWNSHWFATPLEQLLWRISCVVGATAFIPITLILIALMHIPPKKKYISRLFVQIVVFSSLFFTASIFFAARIFLVVESFMGLRHLPPDAFKVVKWANAIPHF